MAKQKNNVVQIQSALNDDNFLTRLRGSLKRVSISIHAKERMTERDISAVMINECLKRGDIDIPAHLDDYGDWRARLSCIAAGERIKVVVAIKDNGKGDIIIVVTVIK